MVGVIIVTALVVAGVVVTAIVVADVVMTSTVTVVAGVVSDIVTAAVVVTAVVVTALVVTALVMAAVARGVVAAVVVAGVVVIVAATNAPPSLLSLSSMIWSSPNITTLGHSCPPDPNQGCRSSTGCRLLPTMPPLLLLFVPPLPPLVS